MSAALILDFDGTISPSEHLVYRVWREYFARNERELPLSLWSRCIGTSEENVDLAAYAAEQGLGERETIRAALDSEVRHEAASLPINPGVVELVEAATAANLPLGIASSSPSSWVEGHLERFGLLDSFSSIRTRDDGPTKPSPYLYLKVLEDLAAEPRSSWAIEDSGPGVNAAKAAGLHVVAVPNEMTARHDLSGADRIVDSVTDITVENLGLV